MAGGKETPRQKMIGMMYLVLTALLALNVSKSILDAFVAIEENIQVTNENEYARGQEKYLDIREVTRDDGDPALQTRAEKLFETVQKIDKITAARIDEIDRLKLRILEECGEDIKSVGKANSIIADMNRDNPLQPVRMHLANVRAQDNYDVPMRILIGENIKHPEGAGMQLWKNYNKYRKELTELIASSVPVNEGRDPFYFRDPGINRFSGFDDLNRKVQEAIDASNVSMDDKEAIKKIYVSLTKQEYSEVQEIKNVHWIGKTFDHAPAVAAIASLSSLQKEILTARADAVSVIASRISGSPFSFDKIMALAYGPEIVNANEDVELKVLMVAYNSLREPEVTTDRGSVKSVKDGKALIRLNAGSSDELKISGEITINNKAGIPKTLPWSKTIRVMRPAGAVTLKELNIMYRGYDNKVEAVASGYEQTILTGTNVEIKKKDGRYSCYPGTGNSCKLAVSGYNSTTGEKVLLGTFDFKVTNLPGPSLKLGSLVSGAEASPGELKYMTKLHAYYPPSIPLNASFDILDYEVRVDGSPQPALGKGTNLSENALNLIRMAKKGTKIRITAGVRCPDGSRRYADGIYIVR